MKDRTKDRVYELICDYTVKFAMSKTLTGDAASIAEQIYVSRSLVSLYLNELFKEGVLIKINSRPVYFLDKKTLSKTFQIYINESTFDYVEDLIDLIDIKLLNKGSFIKAIGHDGSLNYCIHQMQSAVRYPNNGLPILLLGNAGSGKTFLAGLLAQFCVDEGLIQSNRIAVYAPGKADGIAILDKLFGWYGTDHKWHSGLIEQYEGGLLILRNVQKYDESGLSALISYFKNGYYTVNAKGERRSPQVRMILTCRPDAIAENWLAKELPIVCRIPDFHERPISEREAIIVDCLLQEQRIIQKKIAVSKKVFNCLSDHVYQSNFKEIQAVVKSLCATSYKADADMLCIQSHHLPNTILNDELYNLEYYDDSSIQIDELNVEYPKNSIFVYFDLLLSIYDRLLQGNFKSDDQFMNECRDRMNDYYDYLAYDRNLENSRIRTFEHVVKQLANDFLSRYQIFLSGSCVYVLSKVIYHLSCNNGSLQAWQKQNLDRIMALKAYLKKKYQNSYYYAALFADRIRSMLDISFDLVNEMFVFFNIYFNNAQLDEIKYTCLIMAHGYSTASSIADAVNRMVEIRVFNGIDMSVDMTFDEAVLQVRQYLKRIGGDKDIIILIDMGSLETLDRSHLDVSGASIGIIDNVNIQLALDVAMKVKQGCELEEIIRACSKQNICRYKLQLASQKKKAIVFTDEAGEAATQRVVNLLKESLPKTVGIAIVTCSYENLLRKKNDASVFTSYQVLLLVGLSAVRDLNVAFISLEDIIAFSDFDPFTKLFAPYMNQSEIRILNENLLKNFSLSSILDHITILNATRLYEELSDSFGLLENNYGVMIPNKEKVGLYIHFSCLIERLVLGKEEGEGMPAVDVPQWNHFMEAFKKSFKKISDYYRVSIPDREIYYVCQHLQDIFFK